MQHLSGRASLRHFSLSYPCRGTDYSSAAPHIPCLVTATGGGAVLWTKSLNRSDLFVHVFFLSNSSQLNHPVHRMTHKVLLWLNLEGGHVLPPECRSKQPEELIKPLYHRTRTSVYVCAGHQKCDHCLVKRIQLWINVW